MWNISLPHWWEFVLRAVIVYGFLLVILRLTGKRQVGQLAPFDLVLLLVLSNAVQNSMNGGDNSVTGGLIGAATLLVVNHIVVRYVYAHERLERWVEGDSDVLMENGIIKMDRLKEELITQGELLAAAHKQGFQTLEEIDRAVLEPGGGICFFAKKPTPESRRHEELIERLDRISAQLAQGH